jgi:hypothetical protein
LIIVAQPVDDNTITEKTVAARFISTLPPRSRLRVRRRRPFGDSATSVASIRAQVEMKSACAMCVTTAASAPRTQAWRRTSSSMRCVPQFTVNPESPT